VIIESNLGALRCFSALSLYSLLSPPFCPTYFKPRFLTLRAGVSRRVLPAYLHSLLNYHTPTRGLRSANTNLLSAPRVRTTFASRGFTVAAPQSGTHSHLAFATLPLPIPFVAFLKLTASSRPSAPPSDSPKCLRFSHWLTLCTVSIHLLTYLL